MENYIQSLRNYIADHPPDYGDGNAKSILEMLFCHYTEFNRFDTDAIKLGFAEGVKVGMRLEKELSTQPQLYTPR